jgi:hypothetical protein
LVHHKVSCGRRLENAYSSVGVNSNRRRGLSSVDGRAFMPVSECLPVQGIVGHYECLHCGRCASRLGKDSPVCREECVKRPQGSKRVFHEWCWKEGMVSALRFKE